MAAYRDPYGPTQDPYAAPTDPLAGAIRQQQSSYYSPGQPVSGYQLPQDAPTADPSWAPQQSTQPAGYTPGAGQQWDTHGYAAPGYQPEKYGSVMAGWEATKWNDPNYVSPKYAVGKILSNYPANVGGLQQAFADIQRAYPGSTFDGKDKVMIPGVGTIDVGQAFTNLQDNQTTSWQWIPVLDQYGNPVDQGGPAGGGSGVPGGGSPVGSIPAGNYWGQFGGDVMGKIKQFLSMDPSNVSVQDSDIAPIAQTHDAALQRARNMAQAQLAEQAAQDGTLGAGGFDTDVQRTFTDYGNQQAGFEAGLVNEKMKERRAQIMQALQLGSGLLDSEMERGLRQELAQMDDATRNRGLTLANSQFYDNLGLTQAQYEAQMNQNLVNSLLTGLYGGGY